MKVWVLAQNNWAEPGIIGVYSDRAAVDAAIERIRADCGEVREGPTDPLGRFHDAVHVLSGELDKPETW